MSARPRPLASPAFLFPALLVIPFGATSFPASLPAQSPDALLRGQVTVEETGRPLVGAEVRVGSEHRTLTGDDGTYRVEFPADESYRVEVRYLGFRTARRLVHLEPDADRTLDFGLGRDVIELSRLVVEVESDHRRAWLRREVRGILRSQGEIFTRREIERINPARLSDLLRRVPGVWVRGTLGAGFRGNFTIRSAGRTCSPHLYLNGALLPDLHPDEIPPYQVSAVAILTRQTSSRFAGCGTILILTRAFTGS